MPDWPACNRAGTARSRTQVDRAALLKQRALRRNDARGTVKSVESLAMVNAVNVRGIKRIKQQSQPFLQRLHLRGKRLFLPVAQDGLGVKYVAQWALVFDNERALNHKKPPRGTDSGTGHGTVAHRQASAALVKPSHVVLRVIVDQTVAGFVNRH